jgi:hypothetical protein
MALVVVDRVQETTTTTGTGTVTLAGAVSGFQSFATIGNANTTYYCVTSGADWEVGIGTYTSAGTTLARTTILASSAAGAAITLAGTSNVFCVYPASKAVYEDASGNIAGYPFTAGTINSTTIGATTASTGAFTTLSASSTVSGTGFSTYLASPPAIGGTAAAAGTFTTLVANTSASVGSAAPAGTNFYNNKTLTGSTTPFSNRTVATVQTDATNTARGYTTNIGVVAAHPTLSNLQHFLVTQASFNASTVTNQIGYYVNSTLVDASTNYAFNADNLSGTTGTAYGFYSNSNISGTGTAYNFYAAGTAPNVFTGTVNIASNGAAGSNFYNAKNITGATTANGNATVATIQSDVTSSARGYATVLATAAASFTTVLYHYYANQGTIGAGSTVSTQVGYYSETNLIGATNNYAFYANNTAAVTAGKTTIGFFSTVNTATGGGTTYAFYGSGTAPSVFNGSINMGSNGAAGSNFYNAKNITGATNAYGNFTSAIIQSDVTTNARGYTSFLGTAAASFSTAIQHFYAGQGTIGAGSTVTSQIGYYSETNLIGATNNYAFQASNTAPVTAGKTAYGFYSNVHTASGGGTTYAFYANGTAPNVFNGSINMGSTGSAGSNFYNAQNITGSTIANANAVSTNVQSDVTSQARGYHSSLGTAAAAFTLSNLFHYNTQQGTIGAGSTVSNQYGFHAAPTLIGANNNFGFYATDTAAVTAGKTAYGFYSNVNTASGGGTTYAFYAQGTAPSVFTGTVNIGSNGAAGSNFYNAKTITGATAANACAVSAVVQSDVTVAARGYSSLIATAAASFSTSIQHFYANQSSIGAGSTVTSQFGFLSESNLIGATNNYAFYANNTAAVTAGKTAYGFYSSVNTATGGGTAFGVYSAGTADNVFRGNVYFGNTGVTPTAKIHVAAGSATASTAPLKFTSGTNLTAVEAGVVEYDGTIMTATPNANFKRGTIPITNYTSGVGVSLTAAAEATLQDLLPAANDTITLSIGTYFLDLACTFTRGTVSTTSAQAQINILGTGGAVGSFSGMSLSSPTAGGATANFAFNAVNINVSNVVTAASTTISGVYTITLRGMLKITTAGTIDPQYNLSANLTSAGTATAPNVLYFRLQQMDTQSAAAFGPAGTGWG